LNRKWVILTALVTLLFSSCALVPKEEELPDAPVLHTNQTTQYTQVAVVRGDLVQTEKISCQYQPSVEETLQFSKSGEVIEHIYVQQGDPVKKGELLAELDTTKEKQERTNQEQVLAGIQLQISQAKENISLLQQRITVLTPAAAAKPDLYADQLQSAQQALTDAQSKTSYLASLLSVEQDRFQEILQKISDRQLRAGIDGTVRTVLKKEGSADLVSSAGQAVCIVSDFATASFTAKTQKDRFSVGQTVTISYDDTDHDASVEEIAEGDGGEVTVFFQLKVPDASLSAGKQGSILLVTASKKNVLYLPTKAIVSLQNAKLVYYVDDSGIKNSKVITTGLEADEKTEILTGLSEGELVIQ